MTRAYEYERGDASCRVCGADRDADETGTRLITFVEIVAQMRQELRALSERVARLERGRGA